MTRIFRYVRLSMRRSTMILAVIFFAVLAVYLVVRPTSSTRDSTSTSGLVIGNGVTYSPLRSGPTRTPSRVPSSTPSRPAGISSPAGTTATATSPPSSSGTAGPTVSRPSATPSGSVAVPSAGHGPSTVPTTAPAVSGGPTSTPATP